MRKKIGRNMIEIKTFTILLLGLISIEKTDREKDYAFSVCYRSSTECNFMEFTMPEVLISNS
jgi:hypothetical protein